jgi:molybdate transport system substrate-binding protein
MNIRNLRTNVMNTLFGRIAIGITAIALAGHMAAASAAEIKVVSAFGAKLIIDELIPEFERTTGNKVTISYGQAGAIRKRILGGESFDFTILPSGWEELRGKVVGNPVDIVHADFGMGIRADVPKPVINSSDDLKRVLLNAKSIVYTDPETGGISGVLFAQVIKRLGITDEINKKSKLVADVFNADFVAKGEADLAVQHAAEIRAVPGIQYIPMPPEFQTPVKFSGAIASDAKQPIAAEAFLQYLAGPSVVATIKAKGYDPH